jgi:hypothetical protein
MQAEHLNDKRLLYSLRYVFCAVLVFLESKYFSLFCALHAFLCLRNSFPLKNWNINFENFSPVL